MNIKKLLSLDIKDISKLIKTKRDKVIGLSEGDKENIKVDTSKSVISFIGEEEVFRYSTRDTEIVEETPQQFKKLLNKYSYVVTGFRSKEILYKNLVLAKNSKQSEIENAAKLNFYGIDESEYLIIRLKTSFAVENDIGIPCLAIPQRDLVETFEKNKGYITHVDIDPLAIWRHIQTTDAKLNYKIIIARFEDIIYVITGRSGIELMRIIDVNESSDSEIIRNIDYIKKLKREYEIQVIDLSGDDLTQAILKGYLLAPFDDSFKIKIPDKYKRIKVTEFKKPKLKEIWYSLLIISAILSCIPYYNYMKLKSQVSPVGQQIGLLQSQLNASLDLASKMQNYKSYIDAINSHKIISYVGILQDIRKATPQDVIYTSITIDGSDVPQVQTNENNNKTQQIKEVGNKNSNNNNTNNNNNNVINNNNSTNTNNNNSTQINASEIKDPNYIPSTISMKGETLTISSIGLLEANLRQLQYIQSVNVGNVKYDGKIYSFSIDATIDKSNL